MKKPLFECKVLDSESLGIFGLKEDLPIRQAPPTTQRTSEENDLHASVNFSKSGSDHFTKNLDPSLIEVS